MKNLRPIIVLSGAALGLIGGTAAYVSLSSASAATSTSVTRPARTSVAACTAGQALEHGVCVTDLNSSAGAGAGRSSTDNQRTGTRGDGTRDDGTGTGSGTRSDGTRGDGTGTRSDGSGTRGDGTGTRDNGTGTRGDGTGTGGAVHAPDVAERDIQAAEHEDNQHPNDSAQDTTSDVG